MLIDCFCNFIEVSLLKSVYNLSQLKCAMVREEMQKTKNGIFQGALKNQVAILGFPQSNRLFD